MPGGRSEHEEARIAITDAIGNKRKELAAILELTGIVGRDEHGGEREALRGTSVRRRRLPD
jgi:hypothetical protein